MVGRKEIFVEMVKVARAANDRGEDGIAAVLRAFPGTPDSVAAEAWCEADMGKTEEFWQSVEKTIDHALIANAIQKASA